jgi:catalase
MVKPLFVLAAFAASFDITSAVCPYTDRTLNARAPPANHPPVQQRAARTKEFMSQYEIDDSDAYLTSDVGGPISDQDSLKAGERGPTLLEDFIFRQKVGLDPCRPRPRR